MQVVLQVVSGCESGRKVWLMPHQRIRVGATEWADFAVGSDSGIASVHFLVRCGRNSCQICDLDSRFGTYVNGHRIAFGLLSDGDVIRAGLTRFRVQFDQTSTARAG